MCHVRISTQEIAQILIRPGWSVYLCFTMRAVLEAN